MPMMPPRRCATCGTLTTKVPCPTCVRRQSPTLRRFAKTIDYAGKRWRTLRALVLAEQPFCPCGDVATVVDHVTRHEGRPELMWDRANLRSLCKPCHDSRTWTQTLAGDGRIAGAERPTSRVVGRFSQNQKGSHG